MDDRGAKNIPPQPAGDVAVAVFRKKNHLHMLQYGTVPPNFLLLCIVVGAPRQQGLPIAECPQLSSARSDCVGWEATLVHNGSCLSIARVGRTCA